MGDAYVIQDSHITYDLSYCGKFVKSFDLWITMINWINDHMKKEQFFPDIFYVNERGMIDRLDHSGKIIF